MPIEKPLYQDTDSDKMSLGEVAKILDDNKHLNFVERIILPNKYKPYPSHENKVFLYLCLQFVLGMVYIY